MNPYSKWFTPYKPAKKYSKKVAYFSMEFGLHDELKIYSGGLGYLAGSHMRSAYELKQNMIGIGILWKYGYYDQRRNDDGSLKIMYLEKQYDFLEDSGITVTVQLHDNANVKVRAMILKPEIYGTVPMYLLTTDIPENDYLSRTITNYLYDFNEMTRISQNIILGIGGAKVVEALGGADIYHLNEGHALPAFYYLQDRGVTKDQMVFTTHTPEKAGNMERDGHILNKCGFFGRNLGYEELNNEVVGDHKISFTVSALRKVKKANAVSKLHSVVANDMWKDYDGIPEIIPITNAQNQNFWQDEEIKEAYKKRSHKAFRERKRQLKQDLFDIVREQTGTQLDPDILTVVWARRFAEYKRPSLLLHDLERFNEMIHHDDRPMQIIWAGKPFPKDDHAIHIFNQLVNTSQHSSNLAVLTGYEMELSKKLKMGSDVWLNTPRITREASGTSGMSAAMNGSLNVSINDGWIPEFEKNGKNSFILPVVDYQRPNYEQDDLDASHLYDLLENEVLPTYYDHPKKWGNMVFSSMKDVIPAFCSRRMAKQYYEDLYEA